MIFILLNFLARSVFVSFSWYLVSSNFFFFPIKGGLVIHRILLRIASEITRDTLTCHDVMGVIIVKKLTAGDMG